jgi:hypothetical protein
MKELYMVQYLSEQDSPLDENEVQLGFLLGLGFGVVAAVCVRLVGFII